MFFSHWIFSFWKNLLWECERTVFDAWLSSLWHYEKEWNGVVFVDASWDNPNYWYRTVLFLDAIGVDKRSCRGILGKERRRLQKKTCNALRIKNILDIQQEEIEDREGYQRDLENLFVSMTRGEDLLEMSLPFDLSGDWLYDEILKQQRAAFVRLDDEVAVRKVVEFFFRSLYLADQWLNHHRPELLIMSHGVGWRLAFVYQALRHGVKVIVPYADHGLLRFWAVDRSKNSYQYMDRPYDEDLKNLSSEDRRALRQVGEEYLEKRFSGLTNDLGADYAYKRRRTLISREGILAHMGWSERKPIVCVFASNWFDYPHFIGMKHFKHFYDWIHSTYERAQENRDLYWLFKAHPCDAWYGGETVKDMIDFSKYDHIGLVNESWTGRDILENIDAVITYHGTVGLEATALGKPVLVADQGWYHDCGFVKTVSSREEYLNYLGGEWWHDMDLKKNQETAQVFSGIYWGRPAWQKEYLLEDDTKQWSLYKRLPELIRNHEREVAQERQELARWYESDKPHYHTFKMLRVKAWTV